MLFFVHLNLNLTGHPVLLFGKSGNPSLGVKLTPSPPHSFLYSDRCIWMPIQTQWMTPLDHEHRNSTQSQWNIS